MDLEDKRKFYWDTSYKRKTFPKGFVFNTAKLRGILHFLAKYDFDNTTILSVGDGIGFFSYMFRLLWTGVEIISTDYSESGPQRAKEIFNLPSKTVNCNKLPFENNQFHVVTCIDMLEHVGQEDRIKFYAEAARVTKDESYLIVDIPVTRDYHWAGAQTRIDPYEVMRDLINIGFEIYEMGYYKKQHDRMAALIIARKYNPDNWWLENPADPGYRVSVDYRNRIVKNGDDSQV